LVAGSPESTTNNLDFTKATIDQKPDGELVSQVNKVNSITDALIILDNIIGAYRRFDDETIGNNSA
jgi:hypothetical protein